MRRGDDQDPESLSEQLDHEADQLQRRSEKFGDEIERVRQDWQRKRADEGVPGAVPPEEGNSGESPEDEASAEGKDVAPEREAGDAQAEEESG